ncbi:hypothetical protein [Fibrobacter sp.]|uniref:YobI family P-loop NTPase n=1 Tax=Fibrobacter sp. TaxID=35828 RepID=UPI0025C64156|nr:hypothetical protein [Fibrobacter sp.]MBR3072184.1 hypothetical protein [Fibrobacter sp.]
MKPIFILFALALCLIFWGCETADPSNVPSSQQVNKTIENADTTLNADSSSTNFAISFVASANVSNSNKVQCHGADCRINHIHIENTNQDDVLQTLKELSKTFRDYLVNIEEYILIIICPLLFGFILVIIHLKHFILKIRCFIFRRKSKKNKKDPDSYYPLAPTDKADKNTDEAFRQLEFAILDNHPEIKNIAITGPYGSGKSSIWKTFREEKKLLKYRNIVEISLAKFTDPKHKNEPKKNLESEIERAIIQQITFSYKGSDLKYSYFSRIKNLSNLKTFILAYLLFFSIVIISSLANDTISNIITAWSRHPLQLNTLYIPITLCIFFISIFWGIQKINKLRISKICVSNVEITLNKNESLFSKYISEIVYFFEATKCNCVVIEDLDRFEMQSIFTKLRELNKLINSYPPTKDNVKFIYMVKDDILTAEERTKFFDYIVTIVPIINGGNDSIKFIQDHYLRDDPKKIEDDKPYLSEDFLQKIKIYLTDLRIIKNCFNEFKIYKRMNVIQHGKLMEQIKAENKDKQKELNEIYGKDHDEKLFSLILYKNLFPNDFQKILKKEGVLYYSLNNAIIDYEKESENSQEDSSETDTNQ